MMIGLTPRCADLYEKIVALYKIQQTSLTINQIAFAAGVKPYLAIEMLAPLIRRKFVGTNAAGCIAPWAPPHERVCEDVCAALAVTMDDVRGRSTISELVKARRLIAKRLRFEFKYPVSAICKVVNRHPNPVDEYFHRDRASRRSKQRVQRRLARQSHETRLAA